MKKLLVFLILISAAFMQLSAQERTLLSGGEITHGGFGGPVIKYSEIKGSPGVLVGGRGGWIINHSFVIGLGGYGLANQIKSNDQNVSGFTPGSTYLNFGYGGVELEYIIQSDDLIHFSIYSLIGAGGVSYRDNFWDSRRDDLHSPGDEFFVFEPAANIEANIISFMRINAGVGYRVISGLNFDGLKNSDLGGFTAALTLKFGKF
jgi:hypothetical protein